MAGSSEGRSPSAEAPRRPLDPWLSAQLWPIRTEDEPLTRSPVVVANSPTAVTSSPVVVDGGLTGLPGAGCMTSHNLKRAPVHAQDYWY